MPSALSGTASAPKALADHRVALNRWGSGVDRFVEQLIEAGLPVEHQTERSDGATALRLARRHDHIALVARSLADEDLDEGRIRQVALRPRPRGAVPLALAFRKADHATDAITAVRAAVHSIPG